MAQTNDVVIDGVGFMSLHHHDGRFVRGSGLFAFARRDPDGGRTVFCLELAKDISREAVCGHRAWGHAVSRGMNEVLVHMAGSQQAPGDKAGQSFPDFPVRSAAPRCGRAGSTSARSRAANIRLGTVPPGRRLPRDQALAGPPRHPGR